MATCRSCGADVEWAVTTSGRYVPLDVDEDIAGNLVVSGRDGDALTVVSCPPNTRPDARLAHFVTCPDAGRWRRR